MPSLIVSELTNIGNSFCVAAWDLETNSMVRPMPYRDYWSEELVQRHQIRQGTVFECVYTGANWRSFPHRTEDQEIDAVSISVIGDEYWTNSNDRPRTWGSIPELFDNNIQIQSTYNQKRKIYVPENTQCRSLGGLVIPGSRIQFEEDQYDPENPKLRICISESLSVKYNLSVTCARLRHDWSNNGVQSLNDIYQEMHDLHLRIGLATSFSGMPERCSVQLNGIIE